MLIKTGQKGVKMNSFGGVDIITGPISLKLNSGWVGVASGNQYSEKTRRTPEKAIQDAIKLDKKVTT
jgi:hypothetical protein